MTMFCSLAGGGRICSYELTPLLTILELTHLICTNKPDTLLDQCAVSFCLHYF